MSWARLDESFAEHPKVLALSDAAFRAHVRAICYSARLLTDGVILTPALPLIGANPKLANALVAAGVWEDADGGYVIHDYLTYNPAREEVMAGRAARSEAGRAGGLRSGLARRSKTGSKDEANASPIVDPLLEAKSNPVPSRPVPSASYEASSGDGDMPTAVREFRDMALSKLPLQFARDVLAIEEMGAFAMDYAGQYGAYNGALAKCRQNRELPFAGNLRKYMPPLESAVPTAPKPRGFTGNDTSQAAILERQAAMARAREEQGVA